MSPEILLPRILILFGVGYLAANLVLVADLLRYRLRKRTALLTWQNPKPRYYGISLLLGVALGFLIAFKLFGQRRPPSNVFGEAMMFAYYGYTFPLTTRIARGFYQDGLWSDTGFMPWGQIAAVTWREEGPGAVTLVAISRRRNLARKLSVPGHLYGEARRLLRDKVKAHDIHIGGAGLSLGSRDESDSV